MTLFKTFWLKFFFNIEQQQERGSTDEVTMEKNHSSGNMINGIWKYIVALSAVRTYPVILKVTTNDILLCIILTASCLLLYSFQMRMWSVEPVFGKRVVLL